MKEKVCLVTLGCSKNLVDAECMLGILELNGYTLTNEAEVADIIILNTCGFIESAKSEAIDHILDLAEYKKPPYQAKVLIVTGCLSQRYGTEIMKEFPEVDGVLGTGQYNLIAETVDNILHNIPLASIGKAGSLEHLNAPRVISTKGYAYLKIAEGCSNVCAFCAIPQIRGSFQSRPMEELVEEAEKLASLGYKEIILIGQDTTSYGVDLYDRPMLKELLLKLDAISDITLIRLMYVYAAGISDDLIETLASMKKFAPYLDMPIQHANDNMLQAMNRRDTVASLELVLTKLRKAIPDLILRTTVLVGFPGETTAQFEEMVHNLARWRFDRLGCFVFSPEENTKAYVMNQTVEATIAQDRYNQVMELQQAIAWEKNKARIQTPVNLLVEGVSEDGLFYLGRSYGEAPEIDPVIYLVDTKGDVEIGKFYSAKIMTAQEYDLTAETL